MLHLAQEALVLAVHHGQREEVEVEGLRLVLAAIPEEEGQPKLAHQEVLRALRQLYSATAS